MKVSDPERRARQYPLRVLRRDVPARHDRHGSDGYARLIVADEPTTALDVTVQQQILGLLAAIRRDDDVALLLISHDVAVVAQVCDRVLVMYAGRIVEELPAADLWTAAKHPYTCALVAAVPDMATDLDAPLASIPGRPSTRRGARRMRVRRPLPLADDRCRTTTPQLRTDAAGNRVACWHPGEMLTLGQTVTIDEALAR